MVHVVHHSAGLLLAFYELRAKNLGIKSTPPHRSSTSTSSYRLSRHRKTSRHGWISIQRSGHFPQERETPSRILPGFYGLLALQKSSGLSLQVRKLTQLLRHPDPPSHRGCGYTWTELISPLPVSLPVSVGWRLNRASSFQDFHLVRNAVLSASFTR